MRIFELVAIVLFWSTAVITLIALRVGKKIGQKAISKKKYSFIFKLLNYLPAILLIPTISLYTVRYISNQSFITESVTFPIYFFGVIVLFLGWCLYVDSIYVLGSMWTVGLELRKEHYLVSRHMYALIRHPIYSAWFLMITAFFVFTFEEIFLWILFFVFIWYNYRAKLEEKFLIKNLSGYRKYIKKTKRFIPFVY